MLLLNMPTARIQPESMNVHNRKLPSWPPHSAVTLYCMGNSEFDWAATTRTEKSSVTKACARMKRQMPRNTNSPALSGRPMFIHRRLPVATPASGMTPSRILRQNARISEN